MRSVYWAIGLFLVVLSAGAALWLYGELPDQIPTHWNLRGEVDGRGGKWTLFAMPVMMAVMMVVFYFLPALSPKQFEVDTSRPTYLYIMVLVTGLFAYMQFVLLYVVYQTVQHGPTINIGRAFVAGVLLFFSLLGNVIGKVRKNFYIGIRVPWTLASDRVWNDTHRLAAWLWVAAGLIGFLLIILGAHMLMAIGMLMIAAFVPVVYSFVHYKQLEKKGAL